MDPGWDFVTAGGCQITGDDARIPLETQGTKLDVAAVAYDSIGGATNEDRPGLILPALLASAWSCIEGACQSTGDGKSCVVEVCTW